MQTIQIKDKTFEIAISSDKIQQEVQRIANEINRDLASNEPLFLVILNGAFIFAADLIKKINIPCNISFAKLSSYKGTESSGVVHELIGIDENIEERTIVVIEDIVDTGITMEKIIQTLKSKKAKAIKIATLFHKPEALLRNIELHYVGMNIPNDFIVGYGLDYDGFGRNLDQIYKIK